MTESKYLGGVIDLEGIKRRCRIDEDCGCWLWQGAFTKGSEGSSTPKVHMRAGVLFDGQPAGTVPVHRAAWILSGREVLRSQIVWRHECPAMFASECVNPDHCRAGSKAQMGRWLKLKGRFAGNPLKQITALKACSTQAVPRETVQAIEVAIADGAKLADVQRLFSVNRSTASKIRQGKHLFSSGRDFAHANASVFNWRPAA